MVCGGAPAGVLLRALWLECRQFRACLAPFWASRWLVSTVFKLGLLLPAGTSLG
jgi:hypothetical protein